MFDTTVMFIITYNIIQYNIRFKKCRRWSKVVFSNFPVQMYTYNNKML